jgi:hypothetical protein
MPVILNEENVTDARAKLCARLLVRGFKRSEIQQELGLKFSGSVNHALKRAYKMGYFDELNDQCDDLAIDIGKTRKETAKACWDLLKHKTGNLMDKAEKFNKGEKDAEDITLAEGKFCIDTVNATEFTGKKMEAPEINISITKQSIEHKKVENKIIVKDVIENILTNPNIDVEKLLPQE